MTQFQVSSSTDDCDVDREAGTIRLDALAIRVVGEAVLAGQGFRFLNVNIPPGSTILSAALKICAKLTNTGATTDLLIEGDDEDDPATFSTYDDWNTRPRTTENVTWDLPTFTAETWYTSIDFKAIIQEIINRPGWASGNALALLCKATGKAPASTGRRWGYSWDDTPGKAVILDVSWAPPAGLPAHTKTELVLVL